VTQTCVIRQGKVARDACARSYPRSLKGVGAGNDRNGLALLSQPDVIGRATVPRIATSCRKAGMSIDFWHVDSGQSGRSGCFYVKNKGRFREASTLLLLLRAGPSATSAPDLTSWVIFKSRQHPGDRDVFGLIRPDV